MTRAHRILVLALVALGVLYATWFASSGQARDPAAALVFGLPPLLFAAATLRRAPRAPRASTCSRAKPTSPATRP